MSKARALADLLWAADENVDLSKPASVAPGTASTPEFVRTWLGGGASCQAGDLELMRALSEAVAACEAQTAANAALQERLARAESTAEQRAAMIDRQQAAMESLQARATRAEAMRARDPFIALTPTSRSKCDGQNARRSACRQSATKPWLRQRRQLRSLHWLRTRRVAFGYGCVWLTCSV